MGRFVARRLVQAIPTFFGVLVLTFLLSRLSPSDPVQLMLAGNTEVTSEDREGLRRALGLDQPLPVQFFVWVWQLAHLDFGQSIYYHRPALQLILERIPNSLQISLAALVVTVAVGVPLGVVAALRRGRAEDHFIRVFSVAGHAIPQFWLGLIFVLTLAVQLRWFPIGSMNAVGVDCGLCWDRFVHLLGPVLVISIAGIANLPRILRTEVLEVISQDYVRTARSKGLGEPMVVAVHVLRNALIPVVTSFGTILLVFFSGSLIIERVFNWPGLGRLTFEAAVSKDYPVVQASVVISSVLLILSYLLRDIAYAWVDPRIKVR
ncbi:MAG TPA: ABC transporter permease [Candidatus Limnocylindria bacterium]|nr:ABC transporter permease [Candidatus Limnocylindria bacterium]